MRDWLLWIRDVVPYEARRWRCHLLGHKWSDDRLEYEDAGYAVHVGTWNVCERKGCEASREVWSIYGPARGRFG